MNIRAICLFMFSGLLFSMGLFAQEKKYHGHVYDDSNQPLAGVIVSIHDTDTKTVTDESGFFEITIPEDVNTIYVEHPDMKPSSASVGLSDVIDIYMVSKNSDAMAEMSLEELMNIDISIASTKADKILTSVSTVTVIDRKTLDSYQFENIQEAIQTVSGVEIYRTYLKRNLATSRGVLQDHYANKVLIMVNNIPMWHAVTGEGCLDRININDVERIEVLKGPASVLYGTNAYSGAINIVLKEKADYTNSSYAKAGSNGLLGGGSHVLLSKDERTLFLSANIRNEEGYEYSFTDEGGNTNSLKEYMNTRNITGVIKDKHTSFFLNYYETEESYFGVTPNFSAGAGNPHNLKGFSSNVKTAYELSSNFSLNYSFTYDWNSRDLSRSADDNIRANIDGYRTNNILSFSYNFTENLNVEAGGNWEFRQSNKYANYNVSGDSVLTDNNMKGIDVNAYSAFGQLNFNSEKFNITLGSRFTHNELFKNNLSSRATVVFKAGPKSSLKLIYGESFRAPSLFEQNFTTTSFTVVGNPNLKPETSKSIELSYLKTVSGFIYPVECISCYLLS